MMKTYIFLLLFSLSYNLAFSGEIGFAKVVTASSSLGTNLTKKINDGNETTSRWESVWGKDNEWVKIDLGDAYDVSSMRVVWEAASAKDYKVETSPNDIDWTEISNKTETALARTDVFNYTTEAKAVRYIRLNLLTRNNPTYGFSIYEWQIDGTLSNIAPIPTRVIIMPKNVQLVSEMPATLKVLSINNSLIQRNNQPLVFNAFASSAGKTATWTKQDRLGQTLRYHYEQGEDMTADGPSAKMVVRSQPWTHIILQEQSNKPMNNPSDFKASVKLWVDYIRANCPNPNAKIILTENWAYENSADYNGDSQALYQSYLDVAKELGVTVCPVGDAYTAIRTAEGAAQVKALYDQTDGVDERRHPTMLGSYLSTCLVYATLYNTSPVGITYYPSEISTSNATKMQQYAWDTYNQHEDVADDLNGTIRFSYEAVDQFNRPLDPQPAINFAVTGEGSVSNGIYTNNVKTLGTNTVTATSGSLIPATATVDVVKMTESTADADVFAPINSTTPYTQNFDNMEPDATASLPAAWKISKDIDNPRTLGIYATAMDQTEQVNDVTMASNAKNGIYNYGNSANPTDRCIGGLTTGTGTASGADAVTMYVKLKNTDTKTITSLNISYDIEKYRKGNNSAGFIFKMYYSTDGANWTDAGSSFESFFSTDGVTEGYAVVPGNIRPVSSILTRSIAPGETLYLAWNYSVASGNTPQGAQALGIDNVNISVNTMLPLDLVSFTAELKKNLVSQVLLKWRTANEINVEGFELERSADGDTFETIAKIPAKNTAETKNYQFTDVSPLEAVSYYRLKSVDFDGEYTYSEVKAVNNATDQTDIQLYPNPVANEFTISAPGAFQGGKVTITNIAGKTVLIKDFYNKQNINVSELPAGMYTVELRKNQEHWVIKFIKK